MHEILRRKVDGVKDEAIRFASELVRTPSVTGEEEEVAGLVAKKMESLGFHRVVTDEFGNVLGLIMGRKANPTLLLGTHMDTVPAGDVSAWEKSPYSGDIEDGSLLGLGASDCKGGIAAQMFAVEALRRSTLPFDGSIVLAVTTGEEAGDSAGMRALIEKTLPSLEIQPTYAILGEPTDMGLYYGHDGWTQFELSVLGINPLQVTDATQAIIKDTARRYGFDDNDRWALSLDPPRFGQRNGHIRADVIVSKRTHLGENIERTLKQIEHDAQSLAESVTHAAVTVKAPETEEPLPGKQVTCVEKMVQAWSIDPFHPLLEQSRFALKAAGVDARPGKWQLPRKGMATAGGVLSQTYGIPTIGYGPGSEREAHAVNESVRVDDIVSTVYGTAAIVQRLVGLPVWGWGGEDY